MVVCEPSLLRLSHHLILRILLLVPTLTTCYFGIPLFTPHSVSNEWPWYTEHTPRALSDKTVNMPHPRGPTSQIQHSTMTSRLKSFQTRSHRFDLATASGPCPLPLPVTSRQSRPDGICRSDQQRSSRAPPFDICCAAIRALPLHNPATVIERASFTAGCQEERTASCTVICLEIYRVPRLLCMCFSCSSI